MNREHFAVNDVLEFSLEVLAKAGYSAEKARATALALLEADSQGIFTHGTAGGTGLEEAVVRAGVTATVKLDSEPEYHEQKYPTILVVNANAAPGHYTSEIAVERVKEMARQFGFAKVYVYNANHFGAAGVWSQKIAQEGDLKGVVTCTTAACVRVTGDDPEDHLDYTKGAGKVNRIGTNPTAISVPHTDGVVTLDTAWTRLALSHCFKQLKSGGMLTIPEYIADSNMKSTLDPCDYAATMGDPPTGSVFPLGSTLAGYKGDSMLRFIEMDNALGGGPIAQVGGKNGRLISHTFEAQAIDVLYSTEEARVRIHDLMKDYEGTYFGPASRWPGDRALAAKKQINTLRRAAEHVGLSFGLKSQGLHEFPHDLFNK